MNIRNLKDFYEKTLYNVHLFSAHDFLFAFLYLQTIPPCLEEPQTQYMIDNLQWPQ